MTVSNASRFLGVNKNPNGAINSLFIGYKGIRDNKSKYTEKPTEVGQCRKQKFCSEKQIFKNYKIYDSSYTITRCVSKKTKNQNRAVTSSCHPLIMKC